MWVQKIKLPKYKMRDVAIGREKMQEVLINGPQVLQREPHMRHDSNKKEKKR